MRPTFTWAAIRTTVLPVAVLAAAVAFTTINDPLPTSPSAATRPTNRPGVTPTPPGIKPFVVSGGSVTGLAPGQQVPLYLEFSNPNNQDITVTKVRVTLDGTDQPGCSASANFVVVENFEGSLLLPRRGSATLTNPEVTGPIVMMRDLPQPQDACKGATLTMDYDARGTNR